MPIILIKIYNTLSAIAQQELGNANRSSEIKKFDGSTLTAAEASILKAGDVIWLPAVTPQPTAPQPGQGGVPGTAGAFVSTVVSNGVTNHYYATGYLTVQPSGKATWYGYGTGKPEVTITAEPINEPVAFTDSDGTMSKAVSLDNALAGGVDLGNGGIASSSVTLQGASIGGSDLNDYYRFTLSDYNKVELQLKGLSAKAGFELIRDIDGNGQIDAAEVVASAISKEGITATPLRTPLLEPGIYYVRVFPGETGAQTNYDLHLSTTPTDIDGNGSILTAQGWGSTVDLGDKWITGASGSVGGADQHDFYTFALNEEQDITLKFDGTNTPATFELIQDNNGNGRVDSGEIFIGLGTATQAITKNLKPGTYYVRVNANGAGVNSNYRLSLTGEPPYKSAIEKEYEAVKGLLGNPTGGYAPANSQYGTTGYWKGYNNGTIHWSAKYGAVAVWYGIQDAYNQTGGSGGWLGFPTKREYDWEGGRRTDFEGGYIYWTPKEGARVFHNGELPWNKAIDTEYEAVKGLLGNPTGGYSVAGVSPQGTTGYWRGYEHGTVHWTPKYGAVALWHEIQNAYNQTGGSGGWLGFPTKREYDWEGGQRTDFEGGFIYWTPSSGAKAYRPGEIPNERPVVNVWNLTVKKGEDLFMQDKFGKSDPNGDAITQYRFINYDSTFGYFGGNGWRSGPNGSIFETDAANLNRVYFRGVQPGNSNVGIQVYDGREWSDTQWLTITTQAKQPDIISSSGESGTGQITAGNNPNFRSYPWADSSTLIQSGIASGTTLTLLEKVTTNDPTLTDTTWYKVRLNDGRVGYIWADYVEKVASGESGGGSTSGGTSGGTSDGSGSGGSSGGGGTSSGGYNPIPGVIPPPAVSIYSVSNAENGSNSVLGGQSIRVSKNSNTQDMEFYLGGRKIGGTLDYLNDGTFTAKLNIPSDMSSGNYLVKILAKNRAGLVQSFDSFSGMTVVNTDVQPSVKLNLVEADSQSISGSTIQPGEKIQDYKNLPYYFAISTIQDSLNSSYLKNGKGTIWSFDLYNLGYADAVVEIYNANGDLIEIRGVQGLRVPTSVFGFPAEAIIRLGKLATEGFGLDDPRNSLGHSKITEIRNMVVPQDGYFKITKSGSAANTYNQATFLLGILYDTVVPLLPDWLGAKTTFKAGLLYSLFTKLQQARVGNIVKAGAFLTSASTATSFMNGSWLEMEPFKDLMEIGLQVLIEESLKEVSSNVLNATILSKSLNSWILAAETFAKGSNMFLQWLDWDRSQRAEKEAGTIKWPEN